MYCSLEDAFPDTQKKSTCWKEPVKEEHKPIQTAAVEQPTSCHNSLHHCFSCATCQKLIMLYNHQQQMQQHQFQQQQMILGAQVSEKKRRRSSRRSDEGRGGRFGGSVINERISANSSLTWGHLLVIFAGGAFLLLIIEQFKKH